MPKRAFLHGLLAATHNAAVVQRETVVPEVFGRCLNSDYCALGDARSVVRIEPGAAFVCPECGHKLAPAVRWHRPREAGLMVAGILMVTGSAALGFLVMHGPAKAPPGQHAWHRVAMIAKPDPEPPRRLVPRKVPAPVASAAMVPVMVIEVASAAFTPPPPEVTELISSAEFTPEPMQTSVISSSGTEAVPVHVVLRLAGAGPHGAGLLGDFARAFLARHESDIQVSEDQPGRVLIQGTRGARRDGIVLLVTNTEAGFAALARGDADIALADRAPDPAERARLPGAVGMEEVAALASGGAAGRRAPGLRQNLLLAGPGAKAGPAAQDFLRFAASAVGQESVEQDGFIKLPPPPKPTKPKETADAAAWVAVNALASPPASAPISPPISPPSPVPASVSALPASASTKAAPAAEQGLDGFETETESTHVFTLPASARMVYGSLDKVNLPARATPPSSPEEAEAHVPPPSPVNGVLEANCAIELSGVPSDCRIVRVRGTRSGVDAVMGWLVSGQVKYAPSLKDGQPAVERRTLVVNYQPPGEAP